MSNLPPALFLFLDKVILIMDTSKIKESLSGITQNLGFLKDYSSLVLPVIILFAAVIIFLITPLVVGGKLQEQMQNESVDLGEDIERAVRNAVPKEQWKIEKEYQDAHAKDANTIEKIVDYSCKRELLTYDIFPELTDESTFIFEEFGRIYRNALEELSDRVRGKQCPTQAELDKYLKNADKGMSAGGFGDFARTRTSRSGSSDSSSVKERIKDALCLQKASTAGVYLDTSELPGYDFWEKYEYVGLEEALKDCWYWQVAYWITEDVVSTINSINSEYSNVISAPVKRLLKVSFGSGSSSQPGGRPVYVKSEGDGLVTSFTDKVSDDEIDVIHFTVSVIIDNRDVIKFQKELCSAKKHTFKGFDGNQQPQTYSHNQITILDTRMLPVERDSSIHELYRYGKDNSLVELELICQYLFDKDGYYPVKPDPIKELLGESIKEETGERSRR